MRSKKKGPSEKGVPFTYDVIKLNEPSAVLKSSFGALRQKKGPPERGVNLTHAPSYSLAEWRKQSADAQRQAKYRQKTKTQLDRIESMLLTLLSKQKGNLK